jgi:type IV pilus assembly protein PilB
LIAEGVISDDQLKRALDRQIANGGFLGETLVDLGYLTPKQLRPHLERVTGFGFVDLTEVEIDQNWTSKLPESYVVSTSALPFAERDGKVLVAMADPLNVSLVDDLRTKLQRPVVALLALQSDIKEAISRTYDVRSRTMDLLAGLRQNNEVDADDNVDEAALEDQAERAPIVHLVGEILKSAMASGASDIHVEPQEDDVRVRFRIDGVLYDQMSIPMEYLPAVVSRLKVMSSLDIAERRRPQDGRFGYKDEVGNAFDVRLSLVSTIYGEKACMRLLEKSNNIGKIDRLGFLTEQAPIFERMIKRPHGLVLVTGPTGSGKSTTLYAALQRINSPGINISTVEDPVEIALNKVSRSQTGSSSYKAPNDGLPGVLTPCGYLLGVFYV